MKKGRIINALILLGVFGLAGSVYVFYFKEKLAVYAKDIEFKGSLERTLADFETTFHETEPELVTSAWRARIEPLNRALETRSKYFNFGKWFAFDPPDVGVGIIKYWYDEESKRLLSELYKKVSQNMRGRWDLFPPVQTLLADLGVHTVDQWRGQIITNETIIEELGKLSYGLKACDRLLDANPTQVHAVLVWDGKQESEHGNLLVTKRIGYNFSMTAENLVKFIESMREEDRYFSIDGMKVTYPFIAYPAEPQLQVQMLLAQATYVAAPSGAALAASTSAADLYEDEFGDDEFTYAPQAPPTFFQKAWRWFNRYILYKNV